MNTLGSAARGTMGSAQPTYSDIGHLLGDNEDIEITNINNNNANDNANGEDEQGDGTIPRHGRRVLTTFDENECVSAIMARKEKREVCGGRTCLTKLSEEMLRRPAQLLAFIGTIEPPDLKHRVYRAIVMTSFLSHVNPQSNHCEYGVPTCGFKVCPDVWLLLFGLSKKAYANFRRQALPQRSVLSIDNGLTGRTSNNARPVAQAAIRRFIKDIADYDWTVLPVRVPQNPAEMQDMSTVTNQVVLLPPRYTKRYMFLLYTEAHEEDIFKVIWRTFYYTVERDMPYVRVSLRTRGLYDQCFSFRDSILTVPDCSVTEKAEELHEHLDAAASTRVTYRKSQHQAQCIIRISGTGLEMSFISYDYARQLSILMLSEQTMQEWFAKKRLRFCPLWYFQRRPRHQLTSIYFHVRRRW